MAQAVGIGVLVSLLFSLVPLLGVRHVRPSLLLRRGIAAAAAGIDWLRAAAPSSLVASGVVALAAWQAGSWRVGAACAAGSAVLALVLLPGRPRARPRRPPARARRDVVRDPPRRARTSTRPGNQTRVVLLAVGLGAFFILGIRGVQANLLREFSARTDRRAARHVPDRRPAGSGRAVRRVPHATPRRTRRRRSFPCCARGSRRCAARQMTLERLEDVRGRGSLAREYTITYRPALERNERVIAGRFWDATPSADAGGVDRSAASGIVSRFDVGDAVRFDVLGQPIAAKVTSVRAGELARQPRAGGFMFVFRPGVARAGAARLHRAAPRARRRRAARARCSATSWRRIPNVSVIDVREVLETARARDRQRHARHHRRRRRWCSFTGVLILVGRGRDDEIPPRRTKPRSSRRSARARGSSAASCSSSTACSGCSRAWSARSAGARPQLGHQPLGRSTSPWRAPVADSLAGIALTTVLVAVVGLVASLDVLRRNRSRRCARSDAEPAGRARTDVL